MAATDEREEDDAGPLQPYVYELAGIAALNSTNLGFDIGVNSGASLFIRDDLHLDDWQVGVFMGSLNLIAMVSGLLSHKVTDGLGRRRTFTAASAIFVAGVLLMSAAHSFTVLMAGRVLVGLGVGVGLAVDPMYIAEVSPAAHRGKLVTGAEIAINVGILLGFVANYAFRDLPSGVNWRVMLLCGLPMPLTIIVLSLTVMPESPRYLVATGREVEASSILQRTHAPWTDIGVVVGEIREAVHKERAYAREGWGPLLHPSPALRRMLLCGIGVAAAQQLNGSESVVYFSPEIFKRAGISTTSQKFAATMVVGAVKTGFIVLAACWLDSAGRRPMLLISTAGMSVCLFVLSGHFAMGDAAPPWLAVVAVCAFVAAFSVGIGPVCWLLAAEVFPLHVRAKAMSIATALNRLISGTVTLTFLPMSGAMGMAPYFALFGGLTVLVTAAIAAWLPETKQFTLEQLTEHFRALTADHSTPLADQILSPAPGAIQLDPPADEPDETVI
eukprot:TRINITY_DN30560_c0_g1_i1.p1 TRINITY_DN30560_c0_g1~~TRINITY_DN30560_c0_g1_i1.p1  ORF type:complete len:513 (+),score=176.19 TRINITY_DN30560_c0_g1_i1:41-1540(+)